MAMTITIDEDDFLEMLVNEVKKWTDDEDTIELFEEYYDYMVYSGCFNGTSLSVAEIVDNDYVNNTTIITEDEFNEAREEYIKEQVEALDKPNREDYDDEEDYNEDMETYNQEVEDIEDSITWEGLETGEEVPDFIDGYKIEAKTESSMLVSY